MRNIVVTSILLYLVFAANSCSKMNDLHDPYLKGEIVYAARIDSVAVVPGKERARLDIKILAQRIDKLTIYWENKEKSKELSIGNQTGVFSTIIDDLPEGEYLFNIVSYDEYNNKSLAYEFQVVTYGELYRSSLLNRRIERIDVVADDVVIRWRAPLEGAKETKFNYTTVNNIVSTIVVPSGDNETTIPGFKQGGSYWYSTFYTPQPNAIDLFETEETSGNFP